MKEVREAVECIILSRRDFEQKAGFSSPEQRGVIKDYDHLLEIIEATFLGIPAATGIWKKPISSTLQRESFVLNSSIAFNLRFYDALVAKLRERPFYAWESDTNQERDISLLLLWKQNLFTMISAYSLALESCQYQAFILLRGYIESAVIIYLSLINRDFADRYFLSEVSEDEYMKLWFKELKPARVKDKIVRIHQRWREEDEAKGIEYVGLLRSIPADGILTAGLVEEVYSMTSDYVHFNKKAMLRDARTDKNGVLYVGAGYGSDASSQEFFSIAAKLLPLMSSLLVTAVQSHVHPIDHTKLMGDFSAINISLHLKVLWGKD
jgi:hypothetical protein